MRGALSEEAARERLLTAARVAFARDGFHAASLNDLLREAGVSKGSFYHHFEDKEALFAAVMRQAVREIGDPAELLKGEDLRGALVRAGQAIFAVGLSDPALLPLARCFYALYHERRWPKVQALWAEAEAWVGGWLASARARGLVREDLPLDLLASLSMAMGATLDEHLLSLPEEQWRATAPLWVARTADLFTRVLSPP